MKNLITKPKSVIVVIALLCLLNLIVFGQTGAEKNTPFETAAQVIGYITSFFTFIALVAGIFWYVFKGKNLQRLNEEITEWEKMYNRVDKENSRLKADVLALEKRIEELELNEEKLKKANLKLQGLAE